MLVNNLWYIYKMEYDSTIKKEQIAETCNDTDKSWMHNVKWKKPDKRLLYDSICMTLLQRQT